MDPDETSSDYPLPSFYFEIVIEGSADTSFQEVSGISAELELEPFVEGGENRFVYQLPKAVKHPNLVLKRGVAKIDSDLVRWCKSVLEQDYINAIQTKRLEVRLLNEKGQPVRSWSFANAYPIKWGMADFKSTGNEVAIENIELAYSFAERVN